MRVYLWLLLVVCLSLVVSCKNSNTTTSSDGYSFQWSGIEDKTFYLGDKINLYEGIIVYDPIDGDITNKLEVVDKGSFSPVVPGTYHIIYSVTNSKGKTETRTRVIEIKRKEETGNNNSYTNPVFEPILADPAIIRGDDGLFYVYGTEDYGKWTEYQVGVRSIPILKSSNLINWEYAGSVFNEQTRPKWGTPGAGIWAPDIVKIGDKYNLYYSLSTWGDPNPGIGVATSEHPLGPWTDHGKLFDSLSIGVNNSIDPAVFTYEGRVYLIWGSFRGLYGVELTSDGLALKDGENAYKTKVHIAGLDTSTPWNGKTYEGAYVIKKGDYFYLFVSSGTCCEGHNSTYHVRVGRSTSPLGPYVDHLGLPMTGESRGYQVLVRGTRFVGPGHNSIIVDDAGDYWIVYHAYDKLQPEKFNNTMRRSLMIDKLMWNDEGWPRVEGMIPSETPKQVPIIMREDKDE